MRRLRIAAAYWVEDGAAQMGAALAYYSLFSLAPLLVLALALAGRVYGEEAARGRLVDRIQGFIGADSAAAVQTMLDNFQHPPPDFGPALIGFAALLYGSLGVFTQMHSSLHRIWRMPPPPTQGFFGGLVKTYLLAFVMVQVTCIFVLLLLSTTTVLNVLLNWQGQDVTGHEWKWRLGDFVLSSFLIALLFGFTYHFMSDGRVRYHLVWGGAAVSALLFSAGKILIGFYLANVHLGSAYGAAGSLVVFLAWVYYSAQIFFFGAEIVRVRLSQQEPSK